MKKSELRQIIREEILNERSGWVMHPDNMIQRALRNGLLTPAEAKSSKVKRSAKEEAEELRNEWPEDEGFGSSDGTYAIKAMLDGAGLKNKFHKNMLMRIVNGKPVRFI